MEIKEQIKEHKVTDYDFMFATGAKMTVSVDHDAGDTANQHNDRWIIEIAGKPNLEDSDELVDAETIEIYKANLAAVVKRNRMQRMPTEEEKLEMKRFTHKLAKLVQ
jgi:hypothetical protein